MVLKKIDTTARRKPQGIHRQYLQYRGGFSGSHSGAYLTRWGSRFTGALVFNQGMTYTALYLVSQLQFIRNYSHVVIIFGRSIARREIFGDR